MKNAYILISTSFLAFALVCASAQNQNNVRNRIEGTERPSAENQVASAKSAISNSENGDVSNSDTGALRPVILKSKGISSYFGYDSKYFYRSNPLATSGKLKQQATGMWTNTFFGGAGLGVYDLTDAVITPYIGASWTSNDYIKGGLDTFNYNSTGAYALLLAQYSNGWSARVGITYSNDRSTENDTEDYMEFHPNIGIMKTHSINDSTNGIIDLSIGRHNSESFVITGLKEGTKTASEKELSNTEFAASYSIIYSLSKFEITPKYRASFRTYDKGLNDGRDDLSQDISLKVDYPISDSFKLSLFSSYTKRTSDGTSVNYDFKSYDGGLGLGLNARF